MIRAIAIDDEPVALEIISAHAAKIPFLQLEQTFVSAVEAVTYLHSADTDLIFMDISMPGISGLELAESLKHRTSIIFTTAHAEHALKGFELAATDYLLKPINFSRFLQACQLAEKRMTPDELQPHRILIKDGHNWLPVNTDDVLYIRGEDNYASVYTKEKRILTRITLAELENKLPSNQFVRVHKSYIISLSKIERIERSRVIIGSESIPLSMFSAESLLRMLDL